MKEEIVLRIDKTFKNSLATVRDIPSIHIAEYNDCLWAKCTIQNDETKKQLYNVRFLNWYTIRDNYLFKREQLTPEMIFFKANWTPINKYFPVTMPTVAMGGKLGVSRFHLQLRPYNQIEVTTGLLVDKNILKSYLINAPNFRFKSLKYAESSKKKIFLFGTPLLPIKGVSYWKHKNVLLPSGQILVSKLHMEIVKEKINENDFILINSDSSYEIISREHIKTLTRKSIIS